MWLSVTRHNCVNEQDYLHVIVWDISSRPAHQTCRISSLITHQQQLQMCSSRTLRLTFVWSFWFAGCTSSLWLSAEDLPLASVCLSSNSLCWLGLDRGELKGRGSGCWTPLWMSIFLDSVLKGKSKMEEDKAGERGWVRLVDCTQRIHGLLLTTVSQIQRAVFTS